MAEPFAAWELVQQKFGFFIGRLGRNRVCALNDPGVEIPSDYHGVVFVQFDDADAWKDELRRELEAAGFKLPAGAQ